MDRLLAGIAATKARFPESSQAQGVAEPTIEVSDRLSLTVGGRSLEIISMPGGETTDSLVVWLPEERIHRGDLAAALLLASRPAAFVTGTVIAVDGGYRAL